MKNILLIILIFSIVGFVLAGKYNELIITRMENNTRLEQKSNIERVESIDNSLAIIKKNIFGVGIGNYILELNKINNSQPSYYYQPAHNILLLIISEIGILGLLFFVGILIYIFTKGGLYNYSFLLAILIILLVDHWLWSLHFGVLFSWLILGLVYKKVIN